MSCIDDVGLFGNSSNGLSENHKSVMSGADIYASPMVEKRAPDGQ